MDSNRGPLILEATALPTTEAQPLRHNHCPNSFKTKVMKVDDETTYHHPLLPRRQIDNISGKKMRRTRKLN